MCFQYYCNLLRLRAEVGADGRGYGRCGRLRRRQIEGNSSMLEMAFMRPVAERFLVGKAAAADADSFPATKAVRLPLGVNQFNVSALHAEGAVAKYCEFRSHKR